MLAANAVDPAHSPIHFVAAAGPSVPVRHPVATVPSTASYRTRRGQVLTAAGIVLASAVAGFGTGFAVSAGRAPDAEAPHAVSLRPVPGEFRLGPGLDQPPGITVRLPSSARPVPGEFRLGPGLDQPPGIVVPLG
jgi:hypothetical protein